MKEKKFPVPTKRMWEVLTAAALLLLLVVGALLLGGTGADREMTAARKRIFAVARVTEVLAEEAEADTWTEGRRLGQQYLQVEVLTGPQKGAVLETINYLNAYANVDCKVGTRIIVRLDYDDRGQLYVVSIPNYDRVPMVLGLAALFVLLLVTIGGKKGLMALLGLVYTIAGIWYLLLPAVLRGADPVLAAILIVALTTVASLLLLTGFSRKTLCAALGCVGGVAAAGLLAAAAGMVSPLNGFNMGEAEELVLRGGSFHLQISGLFVSGILIASLGAVMDVAMSIASACQELRTLNPRLGRRELFQSSMNIGRDAMGTMANTLILAFAGASLNMLLLFRIFDYPMIQIFNSDAMVMELIRGLTGSMGIILTVPLSAGLGAFLMKGESHGL